MQLPLNKLLMLTILLAAAFISTVEISGSEAAGFQTGLCGRGEGERDENPCTELGEGEDCRSRHFSREDGSTSTCDEPTAAGSEDGIVTNCVDLFTGENCLDLRSGVGRCGADCHGDSSSSSEQLPELSYTTKGINRTHYLVDISWTPPTGVAVPGYVLVIMSGGSSVADWDRCGNYSSGQCLHCVVELDNTTFHYRHEFATLLYTGGNNAVIHIKLIPSNRCDGPSVTVTPPRSCHHACPGNCQRCGNPDVDIIPVPINFDYSVCRNHDNSTYLATFWWESGIIGYERPNPMAIFYFYLTTNGEFDGIVSNHIRTQHRPVTLHNLTLEQDTPYFIRIRQYECVCADFKSFKFVISSSVSACDDGNRSTTSSSSIIPTISFSSPSLKRSTTSSTSIVSTISSSSPSRRTFSTVAATTLSPVTSTPVPSSAGTTQMMGNKSTTQSSDILDLDQISRQNVVIAAVISVGVVVVLLIIVLMTVVALRHLQSPERPSYSPNKLAQVSPKVQSPQRLLLLYSWGTSEHSQQCIMQSMMSLLVYDTELVYSAKSEVRGDIPQWVEKHVSSSDKVLIVCNEEFSREWKSPGSTHTEGAIVNALKAIITGHINSGTMDKICSKTALVFLKEKHKELVPSGVLHGFKQYVLCEEDSDKHNELLRFISDTPLFNFCSQDSSEDVKVIV